MLGVRVGDLWQQLTVVQALDPGRQSLAQDEAPAAQVTEAPAEAETADAAAGTAPAGAGGSEVADGDAAAPPASGGLADLDPSTFDETQLALLQDLAARRDALDARSRQLDERAAMIAVAEQRLDEKVAELDALRSEIEGLMGRLDEQSEARIANLASIYEAMRPGDAAAIFNGLEMDVIVAVLDRMRQTKSAPILAGMDPARARDVTAELASRRDRAADAAASLSQ
jgi:flagellar motility protein MotE (MotC chaperone)